jgi:hypothetical protein
MQRVDRIQVTVDGVSYRFDRLEGSLWTLGGAVHDWVDPVRMGIQLGKLAAAEGGRILPGTEPEDRRYGFNAAGSVRVALYDQDGGEERLALGEKNPVTGHVYASGAGRPGCFPVLAETRDALAGLPEAARLATLLPAIPFADLDTLTVRRGRHTDVLERHDGRWWLKVPGWDAPALPQRVRDYHRLYGDRRRQDERGRWVMADERAVALLAYEAGQTQVKRLVPPGDAAAALARWQLAEPGRVVTLAGKGIDPDPTTGDPDHLTIGFGPPLDAQTVPAVRRGNPLLTTELALVTLEAPAGDLALATALTERALLADEIEIATAAGPLLRMRREDRDFRNDERMQWDQVLPLPEAGAERPHLVARNVVVDLDRLPILAVLPPTDSKRILRDEGRVTIVLRWNDPPRSETWECGLLDLDHVPGGREILAPVPKDDEPAGLWRPADGRLLQVPSTVVVTVRNLSR